MKLLNIIVVSIFLSSCGPLPPLQVEEKPQIEKHEEALAQHAQVIDMLINYITKLQERNILPSAKSLAETEELFNKGE